ncbi:hypothetical protein VTL71DRAFT_3234 [Oculimacula yallundae]|uniref:Uncharacterized protein n=1 Tax=Oculimacula yallundae TaxID=86028 RepID=A0ABR4C6M6_9HELO
MSEDFPLPRLNWDPSTESFSKGIPRKRVRSSPPVSSDPIFSGDEDPSADNYTQERRKRKYRGPWYRQRPEPDPGSGSQELIESEDSKRRKRPFERQFDSGVFMGSDGTDLGEGMEEASFGNVSALPVRQSLVEKETLSPEDIARKHIELCLEDGNEIIDLSSALLTSLSSATIRPLNAFTRVPTSSEAFFPLQPKLKLFLSSNRLTSLPAELFNLERLTVLSLRDNEIHELPPSIGKLQRLRELNLSQNGLRYLPYEILDLLTQSSDLSSLSLHPNKFHEAQFPDNGEMEVEELPYKIGLGNRTPKHPFKDAAISYIPSRPGPDWHPRWKVKFQARTEIRYLDITGRLVKGPIFNHSIPVADLDDTPQAPQSDGVEPSHSPSLLEVALLACSRTPQLPHLSSLLPTYSPDYLHKILSDAVVKKDSGGSKCTICQRGFVLPRTEWIEWWEIAKNLDEAIPSAASPLRQRENDRDILESMVPLVRRGCSWRCVPEKLVKLDG